MRGRAGLTSQVVASLAFVMVASIGILASVLLAESDVRIRGWLSRALLAEARSLGPGRIPLVPGIRWWMVDADRAAVPVGSERATIDPESRALADKARGSGATVLKPGAVWDMIRFATPIDASRVAVARIPREASLRLRAPPLGPLVLLLTFDAVLFTAFGAFLLRRSVLGPLRRLAAGARAMHEGDLGVRVRVAGVREAAELAVGFNDMAESLERRTGALEKAVGDLRQSNRELRDTRAGLERSQRLAAVGTLAAGVAHEVGNPMGAVLAFLDLALRDADLAADTRRHLERAAGEGSRMRAVLRQLLDLAAPARGTPGPVDLEAAAREICALVQAQGRFRAVAFEVAREGNPPPAWADPTRVSQILLNLLLNAGDAVRDGAGGLVQVTVRPGGGGGGGREMVECSVADDGPGVPADLRERIFDLFYTSKAPGEGTGLGLANAQMAACDLGGTLDLVEQASGQAEAGGAVFVLRIPAAGDQQKSAADCGVPQNAS